MLLKHSWLHAQRPWVRVWWPAVLFCVLATVNRNHNSQWIFHFMGTLYIMHIIRDAGAEGLWSLEPFVSLTYFSAYSHMSRMSYADLFHSIYVKIYWVRERQVLSNNTHKQLHSCCNVLDLVLNCNILIFVRLPNHHWCQWVQIQPCFYEYFLLQFQKGRQKKNRRSKAVNIQSGKLCEKTYLV